MSDVVLSARSRRDIAELSSRLKALPEESHPGLAARIMADGLMLPTQWWLGTAVRLVRRRRKCDAFEAWAVLLCRARSVASDVIKQTAEWIVNGEDASGEGVGGFDQGEVDLLDRLITMLEQHASPNPLPKDQ